MVNAPDALRAALETRTTADLVAILRNRNEEEWRPEVFELVASILATRGIAESTVAAMGPEGLDAVEEQPLATVARYFTPAEAHSARLALEGAGLRAWVIDETLGAIYGVGIGTRLQVRVDDLPAAQAVLESEPGAHEELPPELAPPPCAKCGSSNVVLSLKRPDDGSGRDWYFECRACAHGWRDDPASE